MRKIQRAIKIDSVSFAPIAIVTMKTPEGETKILFEGELTPTVDPTYLGDVFKQEDYELITQVNKVLADNNESPLTLNEARYLTGNLPQFKDPETLEDLQKLSGFIVEKKITYL